MPGRVTRNAIQGVLAIFLLLVLSGCGQKGDLYLPDDEQASAPVSHHHA